jgi:hypothetical protein
MPQSNWERNTDAAPYAPVTPKKTRIWQRFLTWFSRYRRPEPATEPCVALVQPFHVENGFIVGDYEGKPLIQTTGVMTAQKSNLVDWRIEKRRQHRQHEADQTLSGRLPIPPISVQRHINARSSVSPIAADMQTWQVEPLPASDDLSWLNSAIRPVASHDEGEPTESVKALLPSEQLRYWARRKMA